LAVAVSGISTLYFGYGLLSFTIAILVANLLSIIPSFFLASRSISFKKVEIDITIWKYLFKKAIPIGLMMLFITIYLKAGTVILSLMKDDSAVGIYSAPHRLIEALIIFPTFFLAALFPVLIRFHQSFSDALFKTYEGSFKFLFILVLPMAVVTTMLAEKLTIGIFGMEFINSAIVLRILIWACSLIFLNTLLSYLIIAIDRQRFNVISFGIGALFNVILNLILVPLYSYIGASIALVASQAVIFTLNFIFISFRQFRLPLPGTILKPVFASLFLGFIVWNMKEINLFVVVFTGSIMYFAMLVLLRAFSQEDILMVRTLVGLRQI
jgi:O-antigen/teichoic acid export membrane protein